VTNIALLGNDGPFASAGHTDSIIIVSLNHELRTATMLSLPRDIYLPVPGYQMARINTAMPYGSVTDYPGAGGGMFKDTVAYNFGIPIDYYIRIGFDGFKRVVDLLGGVSVAVTCQVRDWRLIEPELDPQVEENWEMFTLDTGIHPMDGDLALWYVRSRRSSSDFDRGRRQQQVLRAIFDRGLDRDLLSRLPELWETYQQMVETDMPLTVMLQLAAMAPDIRENGIQHLYLPPAALRSWTTPAGGAVQLLQWEAAEPVLAQLMQPPLLNHATRPAITVEVVTPHEFTYRLAAEMLTWYGFAPVRGEPEEEMPGRTQATYFGSSRKGSFDWLLGWVVGVETEEIVLEAATGARDADYRVVLGYNYDPCRPEREAPTLTGNR
jgi:LCP family protein required for cell wall assembly